MATGAQALLRTLVDSGVTACFTNPGTSEMHVVAALDAVPSMRAVLTLFEGVATGAADGWARMSDHPAATLLHLGPGLGNGLANLHNARRGAVPVVNIVGDHATDHSRFDAPLQSDIETAARNVSPGWVRTSTTPADLQVDAAEAVAVALGPPGQVATLIVPADVSWGECAGPAPPAPMPVAPPAGDEAVRSAAGHLRGDGRTTLLLGGRALREDALRVARRIAEATGADLVAEVFPARIERGAGRPAIDRLPYLPEFARTRLGRTRHLVRVDAARPAAFFAYPGLDGDLVPDGCTDEVLATGGHDVVASLEALADEVGAASEPRRVQTPSAPGVPTGRLTPDKLCRTVAAVLPEGTIIADEAQTTGVSLPRHTAGAPPHDLLALTGGAIGQGLPLAVGAAVACPDRPVLAIEADGSAMYTLQALWTMAREALDVTVLLCNNESYAILDVELARVGAGGGSAGERARRQLDIGTPALDFTDLARGMGVPATRVETAEELTRALREALAEPGPRLVEAMVPSDYTGARLAALPWALRAVRGAPQPIAEALVKRLG